MELPFKTILADEVVAARSSPQALLELLERSDPFLYRLAENHHRYHSWDGVEDIYQEYRETFLRCIHRYDVDRAYADGRGFIAYLNWQIRTDYRSHYRRLEAGYSIRDWNVEDDLMAPAEITPDMEQLLNNALMCLSKKDQDIFYQYVFEGKKIENRTLERIHRDIRHYMLEDA